MTFIPRPDPAQIANAETFEKEMTNFYLQHEQLPILEKKRSISTSNSNTFLFPSFSATVTASALPPSDGQ